jgi:transcriptional regulator with XRE-family HTH domain
MESLADRLKMTRTILGLSQASLAERSGVSQTTIASIESGRATGSKHLIAIADALGVPARWLDTGWHLGHAISADLPPFGPDNAHVIAKAIEGKRAAGAGHVVTWDKQDDLPHDPTRVWVDRYDYRFSAGNGHVQWEIREKNALPFNEGFFKAIGSNPADCKLVVCHGRSMEPFLYDKDMIMVDTKKTVPREEKIYALWLEDEPLVKQVFKRPGGGLILHSFNSAYPDKIIEADQLDRLQIFGQCVYRSGAGFL